VRTSVVRNPRRRAMSAGALAVALLLAACSSGAPDAAPLRVGLIPNISPEQQAARYAPFGDYLSERLGRDVELFVATNYAGVVQAMASGRIDLAYFGGITYLQAERLAEVEPLVTEIDAMTGTSRYLSAIVVREDSPILDLRGLLDAGGVVAMGDVASTSGSYAPRSMLIAAGAQCETQDLRRCPPLRSIEFTGGHDAAAQSVLQGRTDAAGLELRILRRLERQGVVPEGSLRVIAQQEVEGYPWVARTAIGRETIDAIIDAFLAIDDPDLLDLLRASGYVRVRSEDYATMRDEAEAFGILAAIESAG
jgi:phosphonate transport system substrate-binding protein